MKYAPFILLAGCMTTQESDIAIEAYLPLPFEEVGRGRNATTDTLHRAILSLAEWQALSDSLYPLVPFKTVDFELEMLLIAALPVPSGGFDLRFEEVEDAQDTLIARYRLYTPGADCRITMAPGNVFQVVRLTHRTTPVTFERTEESADCTEP